MTLEEKVDTENGKVIKDMLCGATMTNLIQEEII